MLASDWFENAENIGTDYYWTIVICMWSGMRVEEAARLRPAHDVQVHYGIPVFVLQEHPAPEIWSPKSEAGARTIPIHPMLLDLELMDLLEQRRREGAYRLFPTYRMLPSSESLSRFRA